MADSDESARLDVAKKVHAKVVELNALLRAAYKLDMQADVRAMSFSVIEAPFECYTVEVMLYRVMQR